MKEFRNPTTIHAPVGAYSHQAEVREGERLLILSGQVGMRPDGTVPEDAIEQLELIFDNILFNLQAAGMEMQDVVKLTYFVVGEMDMTKRRAVITGRLQEHRPCSTFLYVAGLASPVYKVEVEAIASRAG